jgi:hypothetical protein
MVIISDLRKYEKVWADPDELFWYEIAKNAKKSIENNWCTKINVLLFDLIFLLIL